MQHLHLGAGGLGLGLVVCTTAAIPEIDVTLVQRAVGGPQCKLALLKSRQKYYRQVFPGSDLKEISVPRVLDSSDLDAIRAVVMHPDDILLTTALREGALETQTDLIGRLLSERSSLDLSGKQIYIVPCENTVGQLYKNLEGCDFGPNVHFLRCIVDRTCKYPIINGELVVHTEEYGRWTIEKKPPFTDPLIQALSPYGVEFVEDLQPHLKKKQWLVNGPHLALAAMAWSYPARTDRLNEFASSEAGQHLLLGVLAESSDAYVLTEPTADPSGVFQFSQSINHRFSSFPDRTSRVLSRLHPDSLESFLRATYERVVRPATAFQETLDRPPGYLYLTLRTVHRLIYDRLWVYPEIQS
ncbi:hypothetical protein AB0K51_27125 [Kitasatospora sp. NPDC049285]|uniref:hypothetical protein n=1 Tax=Kitasatospora sp. NPDC049285 TaxID=3157096 RepID=UPI00341912C0